MRLIDAIRDEYQRDWCRAFLELVLRARDYTTARRSGDSAAIQFELLDAAALEFYETVHDWRPLLLGEAKPPLTPPHSRYADVEDRRLWRLYRHALSYVPWLWRLRFGPILVPQERWQKIAAVRSKAFYAAVLELSWEAAPAEGRPC